MSCKITKVCIDEIKDLICKMVVLYSKKRRFQNLQTLTNIHLFYHKKHKKSTGGNGKKKRI